MRARARARVRVWPTEETNTCAAAAFTAVSSIMYTYRARACRGLLHHHAEDRSRSLELDHGDVAVAATRVASDAARQLLRTRSRHIIARVHTFAHISVRSVNSPTINVRDSSCHRVRSRVRDNKCDYYYYVFQKKNTRYGSQLVTDSHAICSKTSRL